MPASNVFGFCPDNGEGYYASFNNPAVSLRNAKFVDTGLFTASGTAIYSGRVGADGTIIGPANVLPPSQSVIDALSRSIVRSPVMEWGMAQILEWATLHPDVDVFVTFK